MFASEWIFGVFTSVLPEQNYKLTSVFFSLFFKYKLEFFYKIILTIINHYKQIILTEYEAFNIYNLIKEAFRNKCEPGSPKKDENSRKLVVEDGDLENDSGSKEKEGTPKEADSPSPDKGDFDESEAHSSKGKPGLFGGIGSMFGFGTIPEETPDGEEATPMGDTPQIEEFPWEKYLIKEDVIKKWKIDMKEVNLLLDSYSHTTGEFEGIEVERVTYQQTVDVTP